MILYLNHVIHCDGFDLNTEEPLDEQLDAKAGWDTWTSQQLKRCAAHLGWLEERIAGECFSVPAHSI